MPYVVQIDLQILFCRKVGWIWAQSNLWVGSVPNGVCGSAVIRPGGRCQVTPQIIYSGGILYIIKIYIFLFGQPSFGATGGYIILGGGILFGQNFQADAPCQGGGYYLGYWDWPEPPPWSWSGPWVFLGFTHFMDLVG